MWVTGVQTCALPIYFMSCRVSLSTPDDMKYFAAKLKEFRQKGWV